MRYWPTTLLQIVSPFFFMIFLYALQQAASSSDTPYIPYPTPYELGGVTMCRSMHKLPCINIMFAPGNDSNVLDIMSIFVNNNNERTNSSVAALGPSPLLQQFVIESYMDTAVLAENPLTVVPVRDDVFIYDYALAFPNTTVFGTYRSGDCQTFLFLNKTKNN